jgi:hypothetical protein
MYVLTLVRTDGRSIFVNIIMKSFRKCRHDHCIMMLGSAWNPAGAESGSEVILGRWGWVFVCERQM